MRAIAYVISASKPRVRSTQKTSMIMLLRIWSASLLKVAKGGGNPRQHQPNEQGEDGQFLGGLERTRIY